MDIRVQGVKAYRNRHGKWYAYHRRTGKRVKAPIGSAAFLAEVAELDHQKPEPEPRPLPGTWGALIAEYKASSEFTTLQPRTRADYQKVFDYLKPLDADRLVDVTPGYVAKVRDAALRAKKTALCELCQDGAVIALCLGGGARHDRNQPGGKGQKDTAPGRCAGSQPTLDYRRTADRHGGEPIRT